MTLVAYLLNVNDVTEPKAHDGSAWHILTNEAETYASRISFIYE